MYCPLVPRPASFDSSSKNLTSDRQRQFLTVPLLGYGFSYYHSLNCGFLSCCYGAYFYCSLLLARTWLVHHWRYCFEQVHLLCFAGCHPVVAGSSYCSAGWLAFSSVAYWTSCWLVGFTNLSCANDAIRRFGYQSLLSSCGLQQPLFDLLNWLFDCLTEMLEEVSDG